MVIGKGLWVGGTCQRMEVANEYEGWETSCILEIFL
jgi:hypothetical protein